MYVRSIKVFIGRRLVTLNVTKSNPRNLVFENVTIQWTTSAGENGFGRNVIFKGEDKRLSILLEKSG